MSDEKIFAYCFLSLLIGFGLLIINLFACKDPVDDQNGNPPADPFNNYNVITNYANLRVPSMVDYYEFEHFPDGYDMYLLTKGTRYDIKKAEFGFNFLWNGSIPIPILL